jgi:hypothetical protein
MASMLILPASILEKSRMSLMMPNRFSPRAVHFLDVIALLLVQIGLQRQVAHANDGVHGRADFMAHVGQKVALGLGGFFSIPAG